VVHGKRGELRRRYREGQEDQLGALGLVVNIIVLWNTIYIDAAVQQLRTEGFPVKAEDLARLSPLVFGHINLLGRYSFAPARCGSARATPAAQKSRRQKRPSPEALSVFCVPLLPVRRDKPARCGE
jgi:hypothetical protein